MPTSPGEAIVQDENGISDFEALRSAFIWRPNSILLYAFDLMHLNGEDLTNRPLLERRKMLKALLGDDDESRSQFSGEFTGDADALFAACAERRLEGIVSKLANSRYRPGVRTKTWLKTKCSTESKFVVVGTDRDRKTGALRALLARANEKGLDYVGAAFLALDDVTLADFLDALDRLATPKGLFKATRLTEVRWCVPRLKVRVKHLAASKTLRHATVKGLAG